MYTINTIISKNIYDEAFLLREGDIESGGGGGGGGEHRAAISIVILLNAMN